MFKSYGERQRHLALPSRSVYLWREWGLWETFARRNYVLCDLWYSVLRLSFRLGGAATVVFPRTGTIVLYMVYCKGFDPRVEFFLVRHF